jgi:1,5-anhydro-D-fructose reductase (1,5-anhydro-D-mannitol-forming)
MTIRWGIIGCGDVCEVKSAPALYKLAGSELTIVMRRDRARAEDFARRHGVRLFTTNANEVIGHPEVDAVYIATPPGQHLRYALEVAAANKPCYVEKPMARSAAECRLMVEAFERARTPLSLAYYRRALPRFLALRDVLESGVLGHLMTVSHVYQGRARAQSQPDAGWRQDVPCSGGGLFVDLGSHVVDLLDFLLGPLSHVAGQAAHLSSGAKMPRAAAEDTVVGSFRTQHGALGTLRYQFHTSGAVDQLELVGTLGRLSGSVFGQEALELRVGDQREMITTPHPEHVQLPLIESMVGELSGLGARCPSTGTSALRASQVIDDVLRGYYGGREDAFWDRPETWPGVAGSRFEVQGAP